MTLKVCYLLGLSYLLILAACHPGHKASERAKIARIKYDFRQWESFFEHDSPGSQPPEDVRLWDPFAIDSATYRFLRKQDAVYLYSLGPDMDDDDGMITYDITNGTVSNGDVISNVIFRISR